MSESGDLPSSWARIRLGDIVPYGEAEKAEPSDIPADAWMLELEDIEKDMSRLIERVRYADRRSKSTKNQFRRGDVLYGKLRPYLNKVLIADRDGYCTTEIVPIRPTEIVDGRYLFYWLKHPEFLGYVTGVSHGLNMPRLGTDAGRNAPFILAPIAEQRRIASVLDSMFERLDRCRKRLDMVPALLKRFREAVLEAAVSGRLTEEWRELHPTGVPDEPSDASVGRPQWLPPSWGWRPISAVTTNCDSRRVPIREADRALRRGQYPYYGAFGVIDTIDEYIFEGEYLLIAEDGKNLETRDRSVARIARGRFWVNNHAHILQASARISAEFLAHYLNSPAIDLRIYLTGIDQVKLTRSALDRIPVPLPPRIEAVEIVRRVEELFRLAATLERRCNAAASRVHMAVPAILAKAFRGQLLPQDSRDESASRLLEQIKSEQKTADVTGKPEVRVSASRRVREQRGIRERKRGELRGRKRA